MGAKAAYATVSRETARLLVEAGRWDRSQPVQKRQHPVHREVA